MHPCDPIVASIEANCKIGSIIPYLEPFEALKVPKNFILGYDFQEMQPLMLPMMDRWVPDLLRIPFFSVSFLYEVEIYSASLKANEVVFRAQAALNQK